MVKFYKLNDLNFFSCMMAYDKYCDDRLTDYECFLLIDALLGVSITDFVNTFPLDKTYDSTGNTIDYYYSKRTLDTLLSSGKTHFDTIEDVIYFFSNVRIANRYVRYFFIHAMTHIIHKTGRDVYDVLDKILRPKPKRSNGTTHYLRIVK